MKLRWVLLCAAAMVAAGRLAPAQSQPTPPKPAPSQPASRISRHRDAYVSPAASKSVEIGDFYFHRKLYKGALSRYLEATRTNPDYAPAYLGLGRTYEKLEMKQKALDAYKKYLDALPSQKQADDDKEAHKAIERLERELGPDRGTARSLPKTPPQIS